MSLFEERLGYLMKRDGINQKRLSELARISEASICRYASGKIEPRIDVIIKIAKVFGVSVSYFTEGDFKEPKNDNAYGETYCVVARNKAKLTEKEKTDIIKVLLEN